MRYNWLKIVYGISFCVILLLNCSCALNINGLPVLCLKEECSRTVCVYEDVDSRPKHWAVPLKRPGLPNLHKVSDTLYRGAQPKREGMAALKELGVKTIVDLSGAGKDCKIMDGYDFIYKPIPMTAAKPKAEKFAEFLEVITDPDLQPVFVHCKHGADRTGAGVALYRIKKEGWEVDAAIAEMVLGCYHFHRKYSKILPRFVREYK